MSTQQTAGPIPTQNYPSPPPDNLSFIFEVKVAYARYFWTVPQTNRPIPPHRADQFVLRDELTSYFRWSRESITRVPPPDWRTRYDTAVSVYIQGDGESQLGTNQEYRVLGTYRDVTTHGADHIDGGWREVQFDHIDYNTNKEVNQWLQTPYCDVHNMSHMCLFGVHQALAGPGSLNWMPELLPEKYNYRPEAGANSPIPISGGICGKVALILALVVLSCPRDWTDAVLTGRVRWGNYIPHEDTSARITEDCRVVVVTVLLDPNCPYISYQDNAQLRYLQQLQNLERGLYGPILS